MSRLEVVNIFGANLSTTEGPRWKRHRKVTATCFNEHSNEVVWRESISQAKDMVKYWSSKSLVKSTADDVRTLSLHVISSVAFGKSYKFQGFDEMSPTNEETRLKESLKMILDNCILLLVLGTKFLSVKWLPSKFQKLYAATVTFTQHMTQVYENEKQAMANGKSTEKNLMTSLIRASQEKTSVQTSQIHGSGSLTESEIYGNMFIFNFAGHDTTAHTLAFTVVLLAAKPAMQDWIFEELKHVLQEKPIEDWNYTTDFPRLKRCLAVLKETLRLYTSVPIAKSTGSGPDFKTLVAGGKSIEIPPNTILIPNHVAVHTHPRYWGDDNMEWKPTRWINSAGSIEDETMVIPKKGAFIAWSEGVRNCPGKKFSQVEVVATMAGLFRDWRVEAVPLEGETQEMAENRVMKLVEEDTGQVLLLQMLHPERAPLVWKRR
ncbi:cytochrome P450 protein [Rutstroemia sp. NJR-2017a WRK4]|nr:cytochrome P450 protein [Rutstroemia sp. NJR-2017a WRK4]